MDKLISLNDGLIAELKDLYSAESQLLKALPKMEKKATNPKLKAGFHAHLLETEGQVERLDAIAALLGEKLTGKVCKAMQGLIEEGNEAIEEESENKPLLDALLIGAARRVEHYEIAAYSTARKMAKELGLDEVEKLLGETFVEEQASDKKLSSLLESEVLPLANMNAVPHQEKSSTMKSASNAARVFCLLGCFLLGDSLSAKAQAETRTGKIGTEESAADYQADNTGRNIRDRSESRTTADDQKMGGSELELLAQIRREIMANDDLSTNAQNVKIMVEQQRVILRGPVGSASEKSWIETATTRLAPAYTIVNELEVTTR